MSSKTLEPGTGPGAEAAATALALTGASREEADAFLRDQRHHLHEQLNQIHLDVWEKRLGVFLRLATLCVGLAVAAGLAVTIWAASRADGTLVDAFSVPSQLAQTGLSGEVIATDLTERIAGIRDIAQRNSLSSSREVRQESAQDIKVEIPETGVSLGQAWRYLRLWLGHEHHLTGTLRQLGDGQVRLTVAVDGYRVAEASGPLADLEKLELQAAEQVFASVDPINIVLYLRGTGRDAEALVMAERGAQHADNPSSRARAYGLWASMTRSQTGNLSLALARAQIAAETDPKILIGDREMMWAHIFMGHDEDALRLALRLRNFREADQATGQQGQGFKEILGESAFERDIVLGDFAKAALEGGCIICPPAHQLILRAEASALAHDGVTSRALLARAIADPLSPVDRRGPRGAYISRARYFNDVMAGDWRAAMASARAYDAQIRADTSRTPGLETVRLRIQVAPLLAYALARNGDTAGALAAIEGTPTDCYDCIRTRGLIAAAAKQWDRADSWFAQAIHDAPSIPFAYADWGQSLLGRGQADAAIEKFRLANQKGPRFADPLAYWGEALMAKNQSHLALAKFAAANQFAPNWGRLHLKWGEALVYAGKKAEAQKHFARATQLDLTPSEKSELARFG